MFRSTFREITLGCVLAAISAVAGTSALAQATNTFPSSGNVGIGTTSPAYPLDVTGAVRASGLVTEASVATTWSSYVNSNISMNGQSMISVNVSGSNGYWNGVFLVQGTNSATPSPSWNNAQLIAWSGYNAAMNDVQALIMSNTPITSWGQTYLVFHINGGPGAGNAATLTINAFGSNVNQVNLVSSSTAPFTYTMATSLNTYQIVSGSNVITQANGNVGIGNTSPPTTLSVNGESLFSGAIANQNWATDALFPVNVPGVWESDSNPGPGMRLLSFFNNGQGGGGISWGMAPQPDNTWLSGSYTNAQFLLAYNNNSLQLQGANQNNPHSFTPSTFLSVDGLGNIGINRSGSRDKLEVNGNIRLTEGGNNAIIFPDGTTLASAANLNPLGLASGATSAITQNVGNIGIGTTSPMAPLDVNGIGGLVVAGGVNLDPNSGFNLAPLQGTGKLLVGWNRSGGQAETDFISSDVSSSLTGGFRFYEDSATGTLTPLMTMLGSGNVGIGTPSPGAKLEVQGPIRISDPDPAHPTGAGLTFPDGTTQTTAYSGTCVATGGDYAESVDVVGEKSSYEPGDVMVLDSSQQGHFLRSTEPYSTLVAGIYSTKPGYVGRRQQLSPKLAMGEIPMAMVGIVPTKVTTENGPIHIGDQLVTSSTPGYVMKGTDHTRMSGAVVGKAMGALNSGTGVVEVLVSLQ